MDMSTATKVHESSCKRAALSGLVGSRLGRHRPPLVIVLCVVAGALAWTTAPAVAAEAPKVEEQSVLDVTSTSAKLQAQINPEESNTTYHFEYDTKPYAAGEAPHGTSVPIPDGSLGAGSTGVTVRAEPEGLLPDTTYHYRVVAMGSGTVDGMDRTFTTRESGGEFSLLDGRQWEMVSPPNKHGSVILPQTQEGVIEAAADGSAITYMTNAPTELEPKGSSGIQQQVLSRRRVGGGDGGRVTNLPRVGAQKTSPRRTTTPPAGRQDMGWNIGSSHRICRSRSSNPRK